MHNKKISYGQLKKASFFNFRNIGSIIFANPGQIPITNLMLWRGLQPIENTENKLTLISGQKVSAQEEKDIFEAMNKHAEIFQAGNIISDQKDSEFIFELLNLGLKNLNLAPGKYVYIDKVWALTTPEQKQSMTWKRLLLSYPKVMLNDPLVYALFTVRDNENFFWDQKIIGNKSEILAFNKVHNPIAENLQVATARIIKLMERALRKGLQSTAIFSLGEIAWIINAYDFDERKIDEMLIQAKVNQGWAVISDEDETHHIEIKDKNQLIKKLADVLKKFSPEQLLKGLEHFERLVRLFQFDINELEELIAQVKKTLGLPDTKQDAIEPVKITKSEV